MTWSIRGQIMPPLAVRALTVHWPNHPTSLHWLTIFTLLAKSPDMLSLSLDYVNELGRIGRNAWQAGLGLLSPSGFRTLIK